MYKGFIWIIIPDFLENINVSCKIVYSSLLTVFSFTAVAIHAPTKICIPGTKRLLQKCQMETRKILRLKFYRLFSSVEYSLLVPRIPIFRCVLSHIGIMYGISENNKNKVPTLRNIDYMRIRVTNVCSYLKRKPPTRSRRDEEFCDERRALLSHVSTTCSSN